MFKNETNLCQVKINRSVLMDSTGIIVKRYVLINTIKQKLLNCRNFCADKAKLSIIFFSFRGLLSAVKVIRFHMRRTLSIAAFQGIKEIVLTAVPKFMSKIY